MKAHYLLILLATSFSLVAQEGYEKIYAIMITGKDTYHEKLARCGVLSFLFQTYPNKHLIVINDGEYSLDCNSEEITEVKLEKKYVLGALRNIGLQQVPEHALWIQWDDDDWRHPSLIEEQYNFLKAHDADLCSLKNQLQYAFRINSAWGVTRPWIEGTILCRKKNDVWYPEKKLSEDTVFYDSYCKKYKSVVWNNPIYYYLRFIHGHNSWHDNHFNLSKKNSNEWLISKVAQEYLSEILPYYKKDKL